MATKRIRNGRWAYTVRRKDVLPKPLYFTFDDEREGDEYVARVEALLDRGIVPDEFNEKREVKKSLRDGVRRYLADQHVSEDDKSILQVVLARLPIEMPLSDLTFVWATGWISDMKRQENLAPSTIRHHVGALARALDWLAASGEIPFNPLRQLKKGYAKYTEEDGRQVRANEGDVKEDTERDRRLEGDEEKDIRGILAGVKPKNRQRPLELKEAAALNLIFDMALESAMRMREMYTLHRDQISLAKRTIFLDKTKNGHKRQVPITTVLHGLLERYLEEQDPKGHIFPWWNGDLSQKELRRVTSQLSRQFGRVFSAAGCEDLRFHDLRHEATSRIFERTTLSDTEIMKITGHRSVAMLKRYANLRASNLAGRLW